MLLSQRDWIRARFERMSSGRARTKHVRQDVRSVCGQNETSRSDLAATVYESSKSDPAELSAGVPAHRGHTLPCESTPQRPTARVWANHHPPKSAAIVDYARSGFGEPAIDPQFPLQCLTTNSS